MIGRFVEATSIDGQFVSKLKHFFVCSTAPKAGLSFILISIRAILIWRENPGRIIAGITFGRPFNPTASRELLVRLIICAKMKVFYFTVPSRNDLFFARTAL